MPFDSGPVKQTKEEWATFYRPLEFLSRTSSGADSTTARGVPRTRAVALVS